MHTKDLRTDTHSCAQTRKHAHTVHTHMHTQAPLAAKEGEAADELRRLASQLDAEAQVCMRLRTCTHTHAHAHARAYAHAHVHVRNHVHVTYMCMCICMCSPRSSMPHTHAN